MKKLWFLPVIFLCVLPCFAESLKDSDILSSRHKAKLEKMKKYQEEYLKKHGKLPEIKPPKIVEQVNPTLISVSELKKISPEDVATIQIYKLQEVEKFTKFSVYSSKYGEDSRKEIKGILSLIENAQMLKGAIEINPPDTALVLHMKNGTTRHIKYNAQLSQPFAGLESRKLKEALIAVSNAHSRIAIMEIKKDKSVDVRNLWLNYGRKGAGEITINFDLNEKGDLNLRLQIRDSERKQFIVESQKKVNYGKAAIYEIPGREDFYLAYLAEPVPKALGF